MPKKVRLGATAFEPLSLALKQGVNVAASSTVARQALGCTSVCGCPLQSRASAPLAPSWLSGGTARSDMALNRENSGRRWVRTTGPSLVGIVTTTPPTCRLSHKPRSESSRSEHSRAPPSSRGQSALSIAGKVRSQSRSHLVSVSVPPRDSVTGAFPGGTDLSNTPPTSGKQSPGVTSH